MIITQIQSTHYMDTVKVVIPIIIRNAAPFLSRSIIQGELHAS